MRISSGFLLFFIGAFLFGACYSYSPLDPSLNTATDGRSGNVFGIAGAYAADFLVQMMGYTAILAGLSLAVAGIVRVVVPGSTHIFRWACGILALVCANIYMANLPTPANWTWGIGAGGLLGNWLIMVVGAPFSVLPNASMWITVFSVTGALICCALSLGLKPVSHIRQVSRFLWKGAVIFAGLVFRFVKMMFRILKGFFQGVGIVFGGIFGFFLSGRRKERNVFVGGQEFAMAGASSGVSDGSDLGKRPRVSSGSRKAEKAEKAEKVKKAEKAEKAEKVEKAEKAEKEPVRKAPIIKDGLARKAERKKQSTKTSRKSSVAPETVRFKLPTIDFLGEPKQQGSSVSKEQLLEKSERLQTVLNEFKVKGSVIEVSPGPVVTLFEFEPAPGVKSSRVISLADDIARSMSANAARVAVVPGRNAIGIELPNTDRETVYLRTLLSSEAFENADASLPVALGNSIGGEAVIADLAKMPHLLIAGTTGSGKSVGVNAMILSLLFKLPPERCRFIMVDPKMLELSIYEGIPHLLTPVVTDPKKAVLALKWVVTEMESRYESMSRVGVRNIAGFNEKAKEAERTGQTFTRPVQTGYDKDTGEAIWGNEVIDMRLMPHIVVVIDEMADLMLVAGKDIEALVQRLAQMARAAGIHLITATQRPSVDVITGTIKANFPTRISYMVTTKIDSRTILGEQGAEQLVGMGDLLYQASGGKTQRVHGPFVSDEEVSRIVSHLKSQAEPDYLDGVTREPEPDVAVADVAMGGGSDISVDSGDSEMGLYERAVEVVRRDKRASTSYIQRRLKIGYNRAASLIERLEEEGVISAPNSTGKREVLEGRSSGFGLRPGEGGEATDDVELQEEVEEDMGEELEGDRV